jgi:hypothetical protein
MSADMMEIKAITSSPVLSIIFNIILILTKSDFLDYHKVGKSKLERTEGRILLLRKIDCILVKVSLKSIELISLNICVCFHQTSPWS